MMYISTPPRCQKRPCVQTVHRRTHISRSLILVKNFPCSYCVILKWVRSERGLFSPVFDIVHGSQDCSLTAKYCVTTMLLNSSMYLCYLLKSRILEYKKKKKRNYQSTSVYRSSTHARTAKAYRLYYMHTKLNNA